MEDKRERPYGPLLKLEKVQGVAARVVRALEQASNASYLGLLISKCYVLANT